MSDTASEIVYTTPRRERYHTNPNCQGLTAASSVIETTRDKLHKDIPQCRFCSGEYTPASSTNALKLRRRLEELDPDEIG